MFVKTRAQRDFTDEVRHITNHAGRQGALYARTHAPRHSGNLARNIFFRPAEKGAASTANSPGYRAGGYGGGGNFQIQFGINTLRAPEARFLLEGTGIYRGLGRVHSLSSSDVPPPGFPLFPRRAKAMRFTNKGYTSPIYRKRVLGQKIQDDWWYDAITTTRFLIEAGLVAMNQRAAYYSSNS